MDASPLPNNMAAMTRLSLARIKPPCGWGRHGRLLRIACAAMCLAGIVRGQQVALAPADRAEGYVARLLINEVPFPGENGWISVEDSCAAQQAIIWVLRNRLRHIPPGYTQRQVAAVSTSEVIDLLTAGGVHGQVEGFFRDAAGRPAMTAHVTERLAHLLAVANRGAPGKFARIIRHAQQRADDFVATAPADRFAGLRELEGVRVTGSAYGWMTDRDIYRPGGNFVRIGDRWRGGMGGNRFFTLRELR